MRGSGGYRPNPELIVSFSDRSGVALSVPSTGVRVRADAAALELLAAMCEDSPEQQAPLLERYDESSVDEEIARLVELDVLVDADRDSALARAWADWGEAAWFPHLMTKDTLFSADYVVRREAVRRFAESSPPPSPFKCSCARAQLRMQLPRPTVLPDRALSDVLLQRRTARWFCDQPVEPQQIADLLFYTGGPVFEQDVDDLGTVVKKCSPSPGARHATELYCVIRPGGELAEGFYDYCTRHHALSSVHLAPEVRAEAFLDEALAGQDWFTGAPMVVFFTCVRERLAWKYRAARTYRIAHFEIGHYCQTFVLVATALGLGAFQTGALADSKVEAALEIDGTNEFVMYAAGAGHPSGRSDVDTDAIRLSEHLPAGASIALPGGVLEPTP